ncbi:hypothetical protein HMPREF9554_02937 [Treponema phagedenis F0421]|nr:hypothetical protein HMPREF9554_02937 [Treponema phagedenis F0421]
MLACLAGTFCFACCFAKHRLGFDNGEQFTIVMLNSQAAC